MKTLPAGKYFIGDCCYVLGDGYGSRAIWSEFCDQFFADGEEIVIDGHSIVAYSTAYGDGEYASNVGTSFPVDAGLIGCTPAALWKGHNNPFGCLAITFKTPFTCSSDGDGEMDFGGVQINTRDEGGEDEVEEYDDYADPDEEDEE